MNFPFVLFHMAFKIEFIITVGTLDLILVVVFNMKPKIFFLIYGAGKLHFLQFLTNTSTIIFCRTLMMATYWTFKFEISLLMAAICALSLSVFLSFFYLFTMVASFVLISLCGIRDI